MSKRNRAMEDATRRRDEDLTPMYKDGKVCYVNDEQVKSMKADGWKLGYEEVPDEPVDPAPAPDGDSDPDGDPAGPVPLDEA